MARTHNEDEDTMERDAKENDDAEAHEDTKEVPMARGLNKDEDTMESDDD